MDAFRVGFCIFRESIGILASSKPLYLIVTHDASTLLAFSSRLGLASYIYSLDSSTTYAYLAFAASAFGKHSLIASIQVAQSIIREFTSLVTLHNPCVDVHDSA